MVGAAVGQAARQQEQRHAAQACVRLAARQHHGKAGIRVGAEPLVAMQRPAPVGLRLGGHRGGADVRAGALFGHEHGALLQLVEILRDDLRQDLFHQRGVAELAQRARQRVRHADRAAQAEFGLHEQMAERVLGRGGHGVRPAEHAAAMRQGRQAELAVGQALQLHIGGMLVDARFVRAGAVPHRQRGRVAVGRHGQFVHAAAGQRAQAIQVRQQVVAEIGGQVAARQAGRIRIGAEQVQAARVGHRAGRRGGRVGGGKRIHGVSLAGFFAAMVARSIYLYKYRFGVEQYN
ncbi:Uncharacterised protein [Bordetella pertussis]|nr:Uncharacterised protein [Bordetella pertussis]CPQ28689.1 Uncharacterised protein [Bordetella pertussis]